MLAAFIATFTVTRLVVRLIRSGRGPFGNVQVDGLHIHHLVPGIFLLLIAGALEFSVAPHGFWREFLAGVFGIGAALTLDEFALWLHLNDVYWSDEGRKSVDAVIVAAGVGTVMLVATNPFAPQQGESRLFFAGFLALSLALALVAVFKGRIFLGLAGVMIPLLAIVAAIRLARPGSPWFRRFYRPGTPKYAKAERRARNRGRWGGERIKSTVSGLPRKDEKYARRDRAGKPKP
jgi:hypothetical protein